MRDRLYGTHQGEWRLREDTGDIRLPTSSVQAFGGNYHSRKLVILEKTDYCLKKLEEFTWIYFYFYI